MQKTNLFDSKDVASGFLHFAQFMQKVPEPGFCSHLIVREDLHSVDLRLGFLLSRGLATDNHVQTDLYNNVQVYGQYD